LIIDLTNNMIVGRLIIILID